MKRLALLLLALAACSAPSDSAAPVIVATEAPKATTTTAAPTTTRVVRPRADRDGPRTTRAPLPAPVVRAGPIGDQLDALARCESGGNPRAIGGGNGQYRGAWQMTYHSWRAAGGVGDPIDYSYAEQKAVVARWFQMSNPYKQWPTCWPRVVGGR